MPVTLPIPRNASWRRPTSSDPLRQSHQDEADVAAVRAAVATVEAVLVVVATSVAVEEQEEGIGNLRDPHCRN